MGNLLKGILAIVLMANVLMLTAQSSSKKNLLVIMTDQQRYDAISHAGNTIIKTPNMDRLAKSGAYFKNAYTPCAVCGPARSSILTGATVESTGVNSNEQTYFYQGSEVMAMPTFDEVLADNGYHCEYYGKWHSMSSHTNIYKNPQLKAENGNSIFGPGGQSHIWRDHVKLAGPIPEPGDGQFIDGMSQWPYIANPIDKYYGKTHAELVSSNIKHSQPDQHGELLLNKEYTMTSFQGMQAIEALERLKDTTFSLTVSFHFPHSPMVLPEPYYSMYPVNEMPVPVSIHDDMQNSPYKTSNSRESRTEYADTVKIKYMISEYYGLITEIDDWVGKILDKLDELGIADNTMIVFTSDHGEMLGSHGMREKNVFYEESAHVPLLISNPGEIESATTVDGYVSLIDVYPTILDYLGMPEQKSDGNSLKGLIDGTDLTTGEYVVTEWDRPNTANYMIVKDGWKLIIPYTISSQVINALYDLNTDPYEMNNLLGSNPDREQYREQAEDIRASLVEWLKERNSIHTYSVSRRDLINGGKATGNNAVFVSQQVPELKAGEAVQVAVTMKNTGNTAWIPGGLFKLGSQSPADNNIWGIKRIELDKTDSIIPGQEKTFVFEVTVPNNDGIYNFQWQMIQEGEEWFGAKSNIKQVLFGDPGSYLDPCDELEGWKSSITLVLNETDQQQGSGCIEFTGSSTDEYKKIFSEAFNSYGTEEHTELKFWYYVSDANLLTTNGQVELGSSGKPDENEYNWNLINLTNGWNYIVLKTSEASKMGNPDLSAVNWFRIYNKKTGDVSTRIDAIQLIDTTVEKSYTLLVNNGSGAGSFYEGEEVVVTANSPLEGEIFEKWIVESGSPVIEDTLASTTTLTMGAGSAVISATYIDTKKYSAVITNGTGSGEYYAGVSVTIQANNALDGQLFSYWDVLTDNVEISNPEAELSYFTMPEEDVEVAAVFVDEVNSINNKALKYKYNFNLYPNPVYSYCNLDFTLQESSEVVIQIFDLAGKEIQLLNYDELMAGKHSIQLKTLLKERGTYFLKVKINNDVLRNVLIKE